MTTKRLKAKKILSDLVKLFKSRKPLEAIQKTYLPRPNVPASNWSYSNRKLILIRGTSDARGIKQWEQIGRHVKPKSKSINIIAPMFNKKKNLSDGERHYGGYVFIGFKPLPVFRYEDTEGKPVDHPDYTPKESPPLIEVAERFGIKVKYFGHLGVIDGRCSMKKIDLFTHDIPVYFHELAHAAQQKIISGSLKSCPDLIKEPVAELTAAVLARLYDIEWDRHAYEYIDYCSKGFETGFVCTELMPFVERLLKEILQ